LDRSGKKYSYLNAGLPPKINRTQIIELLETIDGVTNVHDLHVWMITSGLNSLSCHLLVEDDKEEQEVLQKVINIISEKYKLEHTTIQIEKSYLKHTKFKV
jgi:cobalt-zinc-cadmium efflux system protein